VAPERLGALIRLVQSGVVSNTAAKKVFTAMWDDPADPDAIAARLGLVQVGDAAALREWVDAVFAEHPDEAARFAAGERKLQGVLVGLVMKKSGGRADPRRVAQLIGERAGT
jgi:aspartyl-tRNA(Asn)/glutamyl-tRNA(Gln) amidotransferase subunit B